MLKKRGGSTIVFDQGPVILSAASVAGQKEGEGPLGSGIDFISEDSFFGQKTWEAAESEMQKKAVKLAMNRIGAHSQDIDYLFAGDLLSQLMASSFGLMDLQIPMFGLYGACSTMGEALSLGAMAIDGGFAKRAMAVTSSHYASAEKEFRFPLNYGNQRPLCATWTVTGSAAVILGKPEKTAGRSVCIQAVTTGCITDFGVKDSMNMGACMAPAAADTLSRHFKDLNVMPDDYDWIFTGDLGMVGQKILIDLMKKEGYDLSGKHRDCGIEIYDAQTQDTHAGGSGCGCSALTLAAYILPMMLKGEWNRVLFMPTGALLSTTSFHEGKTVPGTAHAVVLTAGAA